MQTIAKGWVPFSDFVDQLVECTNTTDGRVVSDPRPVNEMESCHVVGNKNKCRRSFPVIKSKPSGIKTWFLYPLTHQVPKICRHGLVAHHIVSLAESAGNVYCLLPLPRYYVPSERWSLISNGEFRCISGPVVLECAIVAVQLSSVGSAGAGNEQTTWLIQRKVNVHVISSFPRILEHFLAASCHNGTQFQLFKQYLTLDNITTGNSLGVWLDGVGSESYHELLLMSRSHYILLNPSLTPPHFIRIRSCKIIKGHWP